MLKNIAGPIAIYEKSTFTPVVIGSASAGVGTYAIREGFYTRINNQVFFSLTLSWSAHTGTGDIFIGGLPYPQSNTGNYRCAYEVVAENLSYGGTSLKALCRNGTNTFVLLNQSSATGLTQVPMDTSVGYFVASGSYFID